MHTNRDRSASQRDPVGRPDPDTELSWWAPMTLLIVASFVAALAVMWINVAANADQPNSRPAQTATATNTGDGAVVGPATP